ncbi:hypothetical protein [Streptomyces sp. NPDC050528]|uniref:hypothetical protein n=1 Tax=Streptomyces sp. NPDC050528 TaxID=3365623 RepID=UPI0037993D26
MGPPDRRGTPVTGCRSMAASPSGSLPTLLDVTSLRPRQQQAMDCVLCNTRSGITRPGLGHVRHRGRPFRQWARNPACGGLR